MKSVILDSKSYTDKIYTGQPVYVRCAYFAGFKFVPDEDIMFVNFQLLDYDNRVLTLAYDILLEKEEKYRVLELYGDIETVSVANCPMVPTIVPISAFFKAKDKEEYTVYCNHITSTGREETVYTAIFNKRSYLAIQYILDSLYHLDYPIYYNDTDYLNQLPEDKITTIRVNSGYKAIIRSMYFNVNKKYNILNKNTELKGMVLLTLKNHKGEHFRLMQRVTILYKTLHTVNTNKYFNNIKDFITYEASLENEDRYIESDIPTFDIEYSLSSDHPRPKKLMYCKSYLPDDTIEVANKYGAYIEFNPEIIDQIQEDILNYLEI